MQAVIQYTQQCDVASCVEENHGKRQVGINHHFCTRPVLATLVNRMKQLAKGTAQGVASGLYEGCRPILTNTSMRYTNTESVTSHETLLR